MFIFKLFSFIICFQHVSGQQAFQPNPNNVRNDHTGEQYNNALIMPLLAKLEQFVEGNKRDARLPDDVALIQTVTSLQLTMFELASFYSKFYQSTNFTKHGKGVAIEFESQRCDEVHSSKFPRYGPSVFPWKYYGDSSYYQLNCNYNIKKRKKRELSESIGKSIFSETHYYKQHQKRMRRSINDPVFCGRNRTLKGPSGTLTFPTSAQYLNDMECHWVIQVPVRYAVKIDFVMIDLEENKDCNYDNVTFYEGRSHFGQLIKSVCGKQIPGSFASKSFEMAVKFQSDNDQSNFQGFQLNWTITAQTRDQSNLVLTSTIVVDQIGDLNLDTMDGSTLAVGENPKAKTNSNFKLRLNNPSTCPKESEDGTCYFETRPYIISKIISTSLSPFYKLPEEAVEIIFDHAIEVKQYPDLYLAPKFCVTWNATVPRTAYGAWSRRHGSLKFTSLGSSTCRFSIPGIHALAAAVPPPVTPPAFRLTNTWYFGLYFAIFWITITFITIVTGARINIPEWLNLNQLLALLLFCCISLSGMQMEYNKQLCSVLNFFLYYFGLAVFIWHFLKAAQFTGIFDKFFRKEQNLYAFYLVLGWGIPMFIAGMAGGANIYEREKTQSCWMALVGGEIWGYTSPTYFFVLAIFGLYYNGLRRTPARLELFNYPKLLKRAIRDFMALVCLIASWIWGIYCIINKTYFLPQFFFCVSLNLSVMILCLYARQKRRGFEKVYDIEDDDYGQKHKRGKSDSKLSDRILARKYANRWIKRTINPELSLTFAIEGLREARLWGFRETDMQKANRENKWNHLYNDGPENMDYNENEDEEEDDENFEVVKDPNDDEASTASEEEEEEEASDDEKDDANENEDEESEDDKGNETDIGSIGETDEEDEADDEEKENKSPGESPNKKIVNKSNLSLSSNASKQINE